MKKPLGSWTHRLFGEQLKVIKYMFLEVLVIAPENKQIKLATPHMYGVRGRRDYTHYVALNILEKLDMPGEWYLDRNAGMLYGWPKTTIEAAISVFILEESIVSLKNVNHIVFRGFKVEVDRG